MFVDTLLTDPAYYVTVVVCVTLSIVLHELAHGAAAIWQGDETPRETGHMTWNPLVHMGPMGLGLLFIAGIAFGVMPVNPSRFRSRHGDALVAAAGPLVNAVLGLLALAALGVLLRLGIDPSVAGVNPLWILGLLNLVLCAFNLIPIAPLDGSTVLGSLVPAYRSFLQSPANARFGWLAFVVVFFSAGQLFAWGAAVADRVVGFVAGV